VPGWSKGEVWTDSMATRRGVMRRTLPTLVLLADGALDLNRARSFRIPPDPANSSRRGPS
jgi:hypothetical protein